MSSFNSMFPTVHLKRDAVTFLVLFSMLLCTLMLVGRLYFGRETLTVPYVRLIGIPVIYSMTVSLCIFLGLLAWGMGRAVICKKSSATMRIGPRIVVSLVGLVIGVMGTQYIVDLIFNCGKPSEKEICSVVFFGSALTVAFLYHEAYRHSQSKIKELETATVESQYNLLKNQMQPHFLFNSLNSLSELMYQNVDAASETTEKLADLYRSILANSKEKTSTLASEINIIRDYLAIEQIRFGRRLTFSIQVAVNAHTTYVPSLMLQTLVENAVKHGISQSITGGKIDISVSTRSDGLCNVRVNNTGSPPPGMKIQTSRAGTGLLNTVRRLELLYGKIHDFRFERNIGGTTQASFYVTGARIG